MADAPIARITKTLPQPTPPPQSQPQPSKGKPVAPPAPDHPLRHYDIDQHVVGLSAMRRPIVLSGIDSSQATTRVMLISGHRALAQPITAAVTPRKPMDMHRAFHQWHSDPVIDVATQPTSLGSLTRTDATVIQGMIEATVAAYRAASPAHR